MNCSIHAARAHAQQTEERCRRSSGARLAPHCLPTTGRPGGGASRQPPISQHYGTSGRHQNGCARPTAADDRCGRNSPRPRPLPSRLSASMAWMASAASRSALAARAALAASPASPPMASSISSCSGTGAPRAENDWRRQARTCASTEQLGQPAALGPLTGTATAAPATMKACRHCRQGGAGGHGAVVTPGGAPPNQSPQWSPGCGAGHAPPRAGWPPRSQT